MTDFLLFDAVVKSRDADRLAPVLKHLFVNYSTYAIEVVNFITKIDWCVSEKESVAIKNSRHL